MAYDITRQPLLPAMLQAFQPPSFSRNPVIGFQQPEQKASLYGRLFDRFTPQAGNAEYQLDDEQKRRLFRQGLLQFGVAALQPNGGNTGAAIARGLLAGTQGLNEGSRQYVEDAYRADKMRREQLGEIPAGYREFDLTVQAGGLTPEQRRQAARVKLGLDGRASSAGFGFELVEGPDGRKRYSRRNPRTGLVEIYDETTGQFAPLGVAAPTAPTFEDGSMAPKPTMMGAGGVPIAIDPNMSQQDIAAIQAMEGLAPAPRGFQTGSNPALGVSRRPEDEAAAIEAAKAQVGLQYAPAMGAIDVQTAAGKARAAAETELAYAPRLGQIAAQAGAQKVSAEEAAKTRAELQLSLPKVESDSRQTIALIDKALRHPGRETATGLSSMLDPRNYIRGTEATNFNVILDQLRGGTFLQAFQSLRGGGAITEVEGKKAEQAIARLQTAQSDEEFVQALKDLRDIASRAPTQLRQKIRSAQGVQTDRPAANEDDALINKYLRR